MGECSYINCESVVLLLLGVNGTDIVSSFFVARYFLIMQEKGFRLKGNVNLFYFGFKYQVMSVGFFFYAEIEFYCGLYNRYV